MTRQAPTWRELSAVVTLALLAAGPAVAGDYITCGSEGGKYRYCQIQTHGHARMVSQQSKADCIQGRSWGYDRGGVWVDDGCRAQFEVGGSSYNAGGGYSGSSMTCGSDGGKYRYCPIQTNGSVRMISQKSNAECVQGRSWGYDRGGIWVNNGCRAEFEVGRGGSGGGTNDDVAAAAAVVAGAAIIGAIVAAHNDKHSGDGQASNQHHGDPVPSWAVGTFRGYNRSYGAEVELKIYPTGRVVGYSNGKRIGEGQYRDGSIQFGNDQFWVERQGSGFRTVQANDQDNTVDYLRVS